MELTKFPNLSWKEFDTDEAVKSYKKEAVLVEDGELVKELVIFAWAAFLQAYTGTDNSVFFVDDEIVSVDTAGWTIETKSDTGTLIRTNSVRETGLSSSSDSSAQDFGLQLRFDLERKYFILQSNGFVGEEHLSHLFEHFLASIRWMKRNGVSNVPLSEFDSLQSSATNSYPKAMDGPSLLHELVQCSTTKPAIDFCSANGGISTLSYQDLQSLSAALASNITRSLTESSTMMRQPIIAILIPQSLELYICQLAVLKSGCAFCSINLDTPEERLAFILGDICAPIVLLLPTCTLKIPESIERIEIRLQQLQVDYDGLSAPFFNVKPSDTAYIMYTSGSTGVPKGVPVSHRAASQSLLAHDRHVPKYTRFLQFAAPTFDVSIFEIFFTFFRGAILIACDRRILLEDLTGTMNRLKVDAAELTPTVAGSLLKQRSTVPTLKLLLTIGEMLTTPVIKEFADQDPEDSLLWAMYGPTEAAIHCTIMPAFKASSRVGNIGHPLDTVSAFIAAPDNDASPERFAILPAGFVGELVVGGLQLADGYLNRPEQTAAAFINDPKHGRLYRTGDKARKLLDGSFECLGRISCGQVKLRGQRIELGEIEQTALKVPGCHAAVASVILNTLILFCCVKESLTVETITAAIKQWLPAFMNPSEVIIRTEFPYLPSGKIDKSTLEKGYVARHFVSESENPVVLDETTTKTLEIIRDMTKQVITLDSSLASLGIDSLMAILLAARLREAGIRRVTTDILKSVSVRDLIQRREQVVLHHGDAAVSDLSVEGFRNLVGEHSELAKSWDKIEAVRPCTPVQLGMLIETFKNTAMYWNTVQISLPIESSKHDVQSALIQVVTANAMLRTGFVHNSGLKQQYAQVVWQASSFDLDVMLQTEAAPIWSEQNLLRPIQFSLRQTETHAILSIRIHHAVYDGWSLDLMTSDLERILVGRDPMIIRPQFDTVQRYHAALDNTKAISYWREQLCDCQPTVINDSVPLDEVRARKSSTTSTFTVSVDHLRAKARSLELTPQCFFQAAYVCVLGLLTSTPDVIIAVVSSGRTIPVDNIEAIIGPCMSTLPLRVNISHSRLLRDLLREIHVLNRELVDNCGASMREIKHASNTIPGLTLSDALFIWQETLDSRNRSSKSPVKVIGNSNHVESKLVLEVEPKNSKFHGKLSFENSILTHIQSIEMLSAISDLVNTFVDHVDTTVLDLSPSLFGTASSFWKRLITESKSWSSVKQNDSNNQESRSLQSQSLSISRTSKAIREAISDLMQIPEHDIDVYLPLSKFGIDSLYAIGLSKSLRALNYTSCSVGIILQSSCINVLAEKLDVSTLEYQAAEMPVLSPYLTLDETNHVEHAFKRKCISINKILPCTALQEAMLSATKHSPEAYQNTITLKITGDAENLVLSWEKVLKRHEIFRTVFVTLDSMRHPFVQVVLSEVQSAVLVNRNDSSSVNVAELLIKCQPPYQCSIIAEESATRLEFTFHHALLDATALSKLLSEVEMAYRSQELPQTIRAEPFLQMSLDHRSKSTIEYWCNHLDAYKPKLLGTSLAGKQKLVRCCLGITLQQMDNFIMNSGTSLLAVCQGALAKLLYHAIKSEDVCFGNVVSGRTFAQEGVDRLIFPTFNTIPVRVNLTSHGSNVSLLKRLRQIAAESLPYQLAPLRSIQNDLGFSDTGILTTLMLVQHEQPSFQSEIWEILDDTGNMAFPLVFEVLPNRNTGSISLSLYYDESLFSTHEISELSHYFDFFLYNCIRYPNASVLDLPSNMSSSSIDFTSRLTYPASTLASASALINQDTPFSSLTKTAKQVLNIIFGFVNTPPRSISPNETIHHLGIDSIGTIQLASIINRELQHRITGADILAHPRIQDLAHYIDTICLEQFSHSSFDYSHLIETIEREVRDTLASQDPVLVAIIECIRPCTSLQTGMISQAIRNGGSYINSMTFDIATAGDPVSLEPLFDTWISRHEILRSGFLPVDHHELEFVMVTYSNSKILPKPWSIGSLATQAARTQYRDTAKTNIEKNLSLPPWRALLEFHNGHVKLELVIFHAIFDAHSLRLLLDDLSDLLSARRLPKSTTSRGYESLIGTMIGVSQSLKDSELSAHHAAFWKDQLVGCNPVTFPNMCPLYGSSGRGQTQIRSASSWSHLQSLMTAAGVTLQAVAQTAWAQVLSAYTGEQQVIFGVVLSGRDFTAEAESIPFPCITTVPCAARQSTDSKKLVDDMMTYNSQIRRHQFCPCKYIAKWAGLSRENMYDTILAIQTTSLSSDTKQDWNLTDESASDEYSLSIEIEISPNSEVLLRANFDQAKIPLPQADLLLAQLDSFIYRAAARNCDPCEISLNLISVLPPKVSELPSPVLLLHQFVELSAATIPEVTALEFVERLTDTDVISRKWTYRQLNYESNRIAALLQAKGIQARSMIAVCFEKCPEASFAMIGILMAGCSYVALDPKAPAARKEYMINDSGASIVLSMSNLSSELDSLGVIGNSTSAVYLDIVEYPAWSFKAATIAASDTCYCLYTSGTTGKPKGCEITHENAVQALRAFSILFNGRWDNQSKWLQFASFHFDVSVLEQFWSWSVGISVVSAPRDLMLEDLPKFIRATSITHLDLTPSLATLLHPDDVPSLCRGVFITGGEALRQDILDVWGPKEVIHNGYGPTETTIGCTMYAKVPHNGRPSNIGRQFDNVGTYVLFPGSETPVIRGGIGELCISGKLVGKGYFNNPALSKEKFPTLKKYNDRIYCTGDLVRLLHDGCFEFIGRADNQIKLRGQRLEIGEIDSTIRSSGLVEALATFVFKHPKQQRQHLVSFVVFKNSTKPRTSSLQIDKTQFDQVTQVLNHCREHLVPYMVPTPMLPINLLPLTSNNKVDQAKLQRLYEGMSSEEVYELATHARRHDRDLDDDETTIAKVLSESFNVGFDKIHADSNIFELGLDSITTIRFSRFLRRAGFKNASPMLIIQAPVISALARTIRRDLVSPKSQQVIFSTQQSIRAIAQRSKSLVAINLDVDTSRIHTISPCTPLQEAMISSTISEHNSDYFLSFELVLLKNVNLALLKSAWHTVYNNLSILRTKFVQTDYGFVQAILDVSPLPWIELDSKNSASQAFCLEETREHWIRSNKPLIGNPLSLILSKGPRNMLFLHIFHGLYDGASLPLLLDCVRKVYHGEAPVYGPQFQDVLPYGPLQPFSGHKFWTEHLTTSSANIPIYDEHATPPYGSVQATWLHRDLELLENARRRMNTTHQAIFQACWSVVLSSHCGGIPTMAIVNSGRSIDFPDVDQVIGPMFNTHIFQPRPQDKQTWKSLVEYCKQYNTMALPHQHNSLRNVLKAVMSKGISNPDNLFIFEMQDVENNKSRTNDIWHMRSTNSVALYPMTFEAELSKENLVVTLVSSNKYANVEILEDLLLRFEGCLTALVRDAESQIGESIAVQHMTLLETVKDSLDNTHTLDEINRDVRSTILRQEIARLAGIQDTDILPDQSIFALGLDSIDVVMLSSRMTKAGYKLSMSTIMRHPSVREMLSLVEEYEPASHDRIGVLRRLQSKIESAVMLPNTIPDHRQKFLPATPLQEAMISRMTASSFGEYYNHNVLELREWVDINRLKLAWNIVIEHCEILRTSFAVVEHTELDISYAQVVTSAEEVEPWRSASSKLEIEELLAEITAGAAKDGISKHLLRLTTTVLNGKTLLVMSLPHALYDGWSLRMLHNDVKCVYHGRKLSRPSNEEILENVFSANESEAMKFWQAYLSGCQRSLFEVTSAGQERPAERNELVSKFRVPYLRQYCRNQGITLHSLTQLCWSFVLASHVKALDVVFGVVLSGRDTEVARNAQFPTMNTVAFRCIIHGTNHDMLHYTQDGLSDVRQYQHFPLRKAQSSFVKNGEKLFNSLFLFQGQSEGVDNELPELYESIGSSSEVEYPVCVEAEVVGDSMVWRTACQPSVLSAHDSKYLVEQLDEVLDHILRNANSEVIQFEDTKIKIGCLSSFTEVTGLNISGTEDIDKQQYSAHSTPNDDSYAERIVCSALAEMANTDIKHISRESTIFHHGLDSISAIKLCNKLKKKSFKLKLSDLLKNPTVIGIANAMIANDSDTVAKDDMKPLLATKNMDRFWDSAATMLEVSVDSIEDIRPATSGQLYFLGTWLMSKGGLFYSTFEYYAYGELTKASIEDAWQDLVKANSILRTVFIASDNSEVLQVVLKHSSIPFISEKRVMQPFRALSVSEHNKNVRKLKLEIHHALYDGVSLDTLVQQLQARLNGKACKESMVVSTSLSLDQLDMTEARKFWTTYLGEFNRTSLYSAKHSTPSSGSRVELYHPGLVADVTDLLKTAKDHGVSLPSLLLAIHGQFLSHVFHDRIKEKDLVVGIYLANRYDDSENSSWSTDPTVNIVPLKIIMTPGDGIISVAERIQSDLYLLRRFPASTVSLAQIKEWTGITIDNIVNIVNLPDSGSSDSEEAVRITEFKAEYSKKDGSVVSFGKESFNPPPELRNLNQDGSYALSFDTEMAVRNGALDVGFFVPTSLMSLEAAQEYLAHLKQLLQQEV